MYYRSQGYRYPRNLQIPVNYGGNAFSEKENSAEEESFTEKENDTEEAFAKKENEPSTVSDDYGKSEESTKDTEEAEQKSEAAPTSLFQSLTSKSLFGGRIGSEELLILALVFLLSDTDSDNDIIWLLLLLLFIK